MNSIEIGLLILAITFSGALLGMLVGLLLPEDHLSSDTKTLISAAMAVVGTLSALVLGLLLATASSSFATRNQEVMQISAKFGQNRPAPPALWFRGRQVPKYSSSVCRNEDARLVS
jgi:hypothetical protein